MAKADRLDRLARQVSDLEAEYEQLLLTALHECAGGRSGLFGHKPLRPGTPHPPAVVALLELGDAINDGRERLDMAPYDLHALFVSARGPVSSEAVGEPKQAQAWLARLSA